MRSDIPRLNFTGTANSADKIARGTGSREDKVSCLVVKRKQNEVVVKSNALPFLPDNIT